MHQTCVHKRRVEADYYGDSVFDEGVEIVCRREDGRRLVLDGNGREVMCGARYFLVDVVEPGDMLDGRVVVSVVKLVGVFGSVEGFDVSCL